MNSALGLRAGTTGGGNGGVSQSSLHQMNWGTRPQELVSHVSSTSRRAFP